MGSSTLKAIIKGNGQTRNYNSYCTTYNTTALELYLAAFNNNLDTFPAFYHSEDLITIVIPLTKDINSNDYQIAIATDTLFSEETLISMVPFHLYKEGYAVVDNKAITNPICPNNHSIIRYSIQTEGIPNKAIQQNQYFDWLVGNYPTEELVAYNRLIDLLHQEASYLINYQWPVTECLQIGRASCRERVLRLV